ncbi:ADP-ribosylglycohydrolase family protein [Clavibacter michiganensis subsp. phaseoli]|uniref:ADP-ribosylglycohydrolase family protein n=1 Tax=Clavibacter phaseoli TaxID=1734031 RepID=A0A8I0VE94_9MICO|nr:ADP-ribosylglycohydrolase family protein [Clavibacter phaseoli]MBF4632715.1 ADP-ribosylglycohydrolase family protein [Clavibacter phaseoli]
MALQLAQPQSPSGLHDRIRGVVIGQAVGDALGAPTEGMSRAEIRAQFGRVEGFLSDDPAGTDDSEYAALSARLILDHGTRLTPSIVSQTWRELLVGQESRFDGGGFSEMIALHNLARGLDAPASGSDNHEFWSDGSAMRVAPIGAYFPGNPTEAARYAAIDASVSHSGDGIYCAQSIAAAVSIAVVSNSWQDVIAAGLAAIPEDSWTSRLIQRAVHIVAEPTPIETKLDKLVDGIAIHYYPWVDVGPEATALAFGVFAAGEGEYVDSVLSGVNIGRDADTIAAMAGALAGGLQGSTAVPPSWSSQITVLRGSCIAAVQGTNLVELADEIFFAGRAA